MFPYYTSNKYYVMNLIRFAVIFVLSANISSLLCMAQIFTSSSEVETQTEDPLLTCEAPWRQHGSKCYYTTTNEQEGGSLPFAKQTCKRFGGDLAKPSTYDEHIFIRRILYSYNDTWIGATDNERKHWLDGTPMLYTNFNEKDFTTAAPSKAEAEQGQEQSSPPALCPSQCCGLTTNHHGKWNYASCDTVLNFVCVKTNETVAEFRKSSSKKSKAIINEQNVAAAEADPDPKAEESAEVSEEEMESSESKVQSDAVDSIQHQRVNQSPKSKAEGNPNSGCFTMTSVVLVFLSIILTSTCTWKCLP